MPTAPRIVATRPANYSGWEKHPFAKLALEEDAMKSRFLLCSAILLVACVTAAADGLSGRYSGIISGKKPDGTGPEINLFLILNQRGSTISCTGGLESFDQGQIPVKSLLLPETK